MQTMNATRASSEGKPNIQKAAATPYPEERSLYDGLSLEGRDAPTRAEIESVLSHNGLTTRDPRLATLRGVLAPYAMSDAVPFDALMPALRGDGGTLLRRALRGELTIPDFDLFTSTLKKIFDVVANIRTGDVASYIPQLARVEADTFAMAVCTLDGQQFSLGDDATPYCVQSTCKPINYAIALDLLDAEKVHRHVGREPSGRSFNEITLNSAGLPHNPMINAGAIMCASLIDPGSSSADRFDRIIKTWRALAGDRPVGFDNAVFLSERDTADRNFSLAYFMRENGAFPPDTNLQATLDLYFQCCSITVDVRQMAVIAASLANGGVCPLTSERVFASGTVKNCLSLMASCGMYDFSGEYAFTVGLPAKSGVSGALFITIPGVCGIALWSPRLDALGNSVRGVEFSRQLTQAFNFHTFSDMVSDSGLSNPRRPRAEMSADEATYLCAAAAAGDIDELRRLLARGIDINRADYDGRTALHLAASEGRGEAIAYLLERGADATKLDRWGNTPLDDAERGKHHDIVVQLKAAAGKSSPATATARPRKPALAGSGCE